MHVDEAVVKVQQSQFICAEPEGVGDSDGTQQEALNNSKYMRRMIFEVVKWDDVGEVFTFYG